MTETFPSKTSLFQGPFQLSFWNIIALPLVRECYMHATKEQRLWHFEALKKKKKHRYFVTFVVGNIGELLALLSVHYISAYTHAKCSRTTETEKRFKWKLSSYKKPFFIKICDVMTLWAAWFLYVALIYSQYELIGSCIAGFNISIAIYYVDE